MIYLIYNRDHCFNRQIKGVILLDRNEVDFRSIHDITDLLDSSFFPLMSDYIIGVEEKLNR